MVRGALMLSRAQLLRALPKHALLALVTGAVAGFILYFLQGIQLEGKWNLLLFIPTAAFFANAAVLPVIIPGRYWSLGFIGSVMLFLLLFAGLIISSKLPFPHSRNSFGLVMTKVNSFSYALVLAGVCAGLFYGLLAGVRSAMILGAALGAAGGYLLGVGMLSLVSGIEVPEGSMAAVEIWKFNGAHHTAWQMGVALMLLHACACAGAAMGAGTIRTSEKI
jgi:hypothetical protein